MAMEPPDFVLSPERSEPGPVAAGSRDSSNNTTAALLQLQHRALVRTPPAAFHLASVGGGPTSSIGQKNPAIMLQQTPIAASCNVSKTSGTTPLQPAQLATIAVPTALLMPTGQTQVNSGGSTILVPSTALVHSNVPTPNVTQPAPPIERLSRPMAFDKMESLVREMQDSETGVPVRSQKLFLTSIPSAFMGYDLIEWLMERLSIEESEALNISNQLCQHGYFFPVSDSKTLMVKDDSSLYRFQTPYYWPWQQKAPDQIEYAIYLAKRSLRNKQRHGLEDYETEALASLHKNLKGKWDFIMMQAEEQVRLAKERKKGDKIVGDSQERAYWRVHRPPPGQFTPLEPCPIPSRDRQGKPRKRIVDDWLREVDILKASLGRNRVKMSQACESLVSYYETFSEYDPMMQPPLPSNPWVTEDVNFWQLNNPVVEVPTEKRVKRWGISIEEVVSDPTGLQEFTHYLKKEYSHENIRFWMAVNDLRRSSHSQITRKVKEIYEEFLEPGAPCEINIDGKTMEKVQQGLKNPSRFAFDSAAEHIYMLLLKKDCYPRFVRSEHYKSLMANAIQPSHKKRFFGFGGGAKKKGSTSTAPSPSLLNQHPTVQSGSGNINSLSKRRGSDRSLSGSAHELAVSGVKDCTKVPHSHSQSNLSDIPYSISIYRGDMPSGVYEGASSSSACAPLRGHDGVASGKKQEVSKPLGTTLEVTLEGAVLAGGTACNVCPWETMVPDKPNTKTSVSVSVCPWDDSDASPAAKSDDNAKIKQQSESTNRVVEISEVSERMRRSCGLRQNTLDSDFHSTKRLAPAVIEQRRASMTMAPRLSDLQFCLRAYSAGSETTPPEVVGSLPIVQPLAGRQQQCQNHLSSMQLLQGSLSTSFEENEEGSGSVFYNLDAKTTQIISEENFVSVNRFEPDVNVMPDSSKECPQRCRQASGEDPAVLTAACVNRASGIVDQGDPLRAKVLLNTSPANKSNTNDYTSTSIGLTTVGTHPSHRLNVEDASSVEISVVITSSDTNTTITTINTSTASEKLVARDERQRTGKVDAAPESTAETPIISVIYASSPEKAEDKTKERDEKENDGKENDEKKYRKSATLEEKLDGGFQKFYKNVAESGAAASVATQTMDVVLMGGGTDMLPLNEVEDLFFSEPNDQTEYDIIIDGGDGLLPGYVAPAPTPAPLIAPLAEVELDPPDDEPDFEEFLQTNPDICQVRTDAASDYQLPVSCTSGTATVMIIDDPIKRRKRKERKDRPAELELIRAQKSEEENSERKCNAVCPWDDEDESATEDAPYVKTYSTLGYL